MLLVMLAPQLNDEAQVARMVGSDQGPGGCLRCVFATLGCLLVAGLGSLWLQLCGPRTPVGRGWRRSVWSALECQPCPPSLWNHSWAESCRPGPACVVSGKEQGSEKEGLGKKLNPGGKEASSWAANDIWPICLLMNLFFVQSW